MPLDRIEIIVKDASGQSGPNYAKGAASLTRVSTLLNQIDSGTLLLPEFQRGFVWSRDQVRRLIRSIYLGYPIGGLLLWEADASIAAVRGDTAEGIRLLLLDGQQRLTALYGVVRGKPPRFFDGPDDFFTKLHFNVATEQFQFWTRGRSRSEGPWIDVSRLFAEGIGAQLGGFGAYGDQAANYVNRLNQLLRIQDRDLPEEKITGANHSIDEVVDIFNQVNSGGTRLSKGDLALARLCARSDNIRQVLRNQLTTWSQSGLTFSLDLLLRNITAVATGRSVFAALSSIDTDIFIRSVVMTPRYLDTFLSTLATRFSSEVANERFLLGRASLPVISRLLHLSGGRFTDNVQRDKVLYWYFHAAIQGRYASSTETMMGRDLTIADKEGVDGLIAELQRWVGGDLKVTPDDFDAAKTGSRAHAIMYVLSRAYQSRDLSTDTGSSQELGGGHVEIQHIFPKSRLRELGLPSSYVNAVANFCFVSSGTHRALRGRLPEEYLPEIEDESPGTLASQWIPTDPDLWRLVRYPEFLEERRKLLAAATRKLLDGLLVDPSTEVVHRRPDQQRLSNLSGTAA